MPAVKVLFVLIDGLGDVTVPSLSATPLQHAATPAFDALAARGATGLLDPVEPGLACGSDTAHLGAEGGDAPGFGRHEAGQFCVCVCVCCYCPVTVLCVFGGRDPPSRRVRHHP